MDFVERYFIGKELPKPDVWFDAILLDRNFTRGNNFELPLKSGNGNRTGCYVFFDMPDGTRDINIMYAGKAVKLRNRCVAHWMRNSTFMQKWMNDLYDNPECSFAPYVAVWYSDNRAELEVKLQNILTPKYCVRHE